MLPSSLVTSGSEITRIFHIDQDGGDTFVLVHSPLTGGIEATLNGLVEKLIPADDGSPGTYWFAKRGQDSTTKKYVLRLTCTSNWLAQATGIGATYTYALTVNGHQVMENNERLMLQQPSTAAPETSSGLRITQRVSSGGPAQTQWYLIEWPERNVHVHRRYKEFAYLHMQIQSAFRGTQLLGSLPEPPAKEGLASLALSPKQQASNVAFLAQRQSLLEVFLKRLAVFPGVGLGRNPDFLDFLGISQRGLVEHSVAFEAGAVGVKLKQMHKDGKNAFAAQVSDVLPDSQAHKCLSVGDIIYRVAGEPAFDYDEVSRLLANAELRPIVVHFLCCNQASSVSVSSSSAAGGGGGVSIV